MLSVCVNFLRNFQQMDKTDVSKMKKKKEKERKSLPERGTKGKGI